MPGDAGKRLTAPLRDREVRQSTGTDIHPAAQQLKPRRHFASLVAGSCRFAPKAGARDNERQQNFPAARTCADYQVRLCEVWCLEWTSVAPDAAAVETAGSETLLLALKRPKGETAVRGVQCIVADAVAATASAARFSDFSASAIMCPLVRPAASFTNSVPPRSKFSDARFRWKFAYAALRRFAASSPIYAWRPSRRRSR